MKIQMTMQISAEICKNFEFVKFVSFCKINILKK